MDGTIAADIDLGIPRNYRELKEQIAQFITEANPHNEPISGWRVVLLSLTVIGESGPE